MPADSLDGMPTRRRFLGRAAALAGAGGVAALAGCFSGSASGAAGYTDWLAAPDLFGGRRYFFDFYDVAAIRDHRGTFDPSAYEAYRAWAADGYDHFGLPFDAVDEELLGVNRRVTALRGEWDRAALDERLRAAGYVKADPHAGFDLYRHRTAELAVALDGDRLLRARRTARSPLGTVRLFVDVGTGEKRRYVQADPVIAELTDRLGEATYVYGFPHLQTDETRVERGEFLGARARGLARTIDGTGTTDRVVVTFDAESDVVREDIAAWTRSGSFFDGVRSVDTGRKGRSAVVTVRRPTADLDEITPQI
jgi:hypothetical protein